MIYSVGSDEIIVSRHHLRGYDEGDIIPRLFISSARGCFEPGTMLLVVARLSSTIDGIWNTIVLAPDGAMYIFSDIDDIREAL